jgi:hypothetical protein
VDEIHKGIGRPKALPEILASNYFTGAFQQNDEKFERAFL